MDRQSLGGLAVVSCGQCGLQMPMSAAIIRMGSAQLFACPSCNHQEIWRDTPAIAGPVGLPSRSVAQ
jgi:predicted RNA-binding Zn-ribbon protein involved in translation (DUF1610 family)